MTRSRIFGILAGYEDQNDHDQLRDDPLFKLLVKGSSEADSLASQPTLSRFENRVSIADLNRLSDVFITQFLDSFSSPPMRLTLDIDPVASAAHGQQQLVFFHGHYDQHQYQARYITCAENKLIVGFSLLYGSAHGALGADDDLKYLVEKIRQRFPDVDIHVRGDAAFGTPELYVCCENLRITYTFGMGMNVVFKKATNTLLEEANSQYVQTKMPQKVFHTQEHHARSWHAARRIVIKVEVNAEGPNRRAVVTNRTGAAILPGAAYEEYANRGEGENRHKEVHRELKGGRLSNHRYLANLFRVALHALAYNLLVTTRTLAAEPPTTRPENTIVESAPELPIEALPQPQRRNWFNHRQRQDPLGAGHIETWRTRVIKVAAEIIDSTRRITLRLAGNWPYLDTFSSLCDRIELSLSLRSP